MFRLLSGESRRGPCYGVLVEVLDMVTLASMGLHVAQNFVFAAPVCLPTAVVVAGVFAAEAEIAAVGGLSAGAGFAGVLCHQ